MLCGNTELKTLSLQEVSFLQINTGWVLAQFTDRLAVSMWFCMSID